MEFRKYLSILVLSTLTSIQTYSQSNASCTGPLYELAKRFEGVWQEFTVTDQGEKLEGTLTSTFELSGCVITQRFLSHDKKLTFISFGYVENATNQWYETYVLSTGHKASYRWRTEGEEIITDRITEGNVATRQRLRIKFINPDFYHVTQEKSTDEGKTWSKASLTYTKRFK